MRVLLALIAGALAGAAFGPPLRQLAERSLWPWRPCADLYSGAPAQPVHLKTGARPPEGRPHPPPAWPRAAGAAAAAVHNARELHQDSYGRPGLAHITLAGARHHGLRGVELWLQTFAPGSQTPIHRHACEEVFVVLRGRGSVLLRASGLARSHGSGGGPGGHLGFEERPLVPNDTLVVLPSVVHQVPRATAAAPAPCCPGRAVCCGTLKPRPARLPARPRPAPPPPPAADPHTDTEHREPGPPAARRL